MKFKDSYIWQSGWIHDYYCDQDGAELLFDLDNDKNFECPICHKKYIDEKKKRAWVTKYRYKIFSRLEEYSEKYLKERNIEHLIYITDALEFYAINYDRFPIHDKDGIIYSHFENKSNRCGKITSQGLNEAMITIHIANCINNVEIYLSEELKSLVFNNLFPKVFQLLKPQINKVHNIQCYELCAVGIMGLLSRNQEMIDFTFNSQYSFYQQLDYGVTDEYFWNEGSFHYHLFVLKPIVNFLLFVKIYNCHFDKKYYDIVKKMLIQVFKCSFNNCSLPSPNDGWPNRKLIDYLDVFCMGNELFNNELNEVITSIRETSNDSKSICMPNTGFAMLKNNFWNVFVKYVDNNVNHAHPDKLNIEIMLNNTFLTHDLSTSGYGSSISKDFYKKTYAHNTVVLNSNDQNLECKSEIENYAENNLSVKVYDLYPNTIYKRIISLNSEMLEDTFIVESKTEKTFDYFFHCDAKLITELEYTNEMKFEEYPYLDNIKKIKKNNKNNIILHWQLNEIKLACDIDLQDKDLYIGSSPDNPNDKQRITILLRGKGTDMSFIMKWCII